MIRILGVIAALLFAVPAFAQPLPAGLDKANAIVIDSTKGRIVIKLRTDLAPQHAERIKQLAREGFYNNVPFHRVIGGFMAQTGDGQNFNGTGGSKYPNLKQEFSSVPFKRGIVGMARRGDSVDTANSQFFIMFADGSEPERPVHRDRRSGVGHGRGRQAEEGASRLVRRQRHRSRQDGQGAGRLRHQVRTSDAAAAHQLCRCGSDRNVARAARPLRRSARKPRSIRCKELFAALGRCWQCAAAAAQGSAGMQITVLVSFRRDGSILGKPRITFESPEASDADRLAYRVAVMETLQRCTPLPFTEGLGGRHGRPPITMRFDDRRNQPKPTEKQSMAVTENTLILETTQGPVTIEMRPDLAPNHVARIKELVREGFYDGIVFHRVIEGFMAQTGCPQGTGTGGSGKKLKAEFNAEPHVRGTTLDGARRQPGFRRQPVLHLLRRRHASSNKQYTVWGKVTEGMENVDKIKRGEPVQNPDKIVKARMAIDDAA